MYTYKNALTRTIQRHLAPRKLAWGWAALVGVVTMGAVTQLAHAESRLLSRNRVEQPAYEVLQSEGDVELRRYAGKIVARVHVKGNQSRATRAGFRVLADYIFGSNQGGREIAMTSPVEIRPEPAKIAMTSPVDRRASKDGHWISFTMPAKYSLQTLPVPNDARIEIIEVPESLHLTQSISGTPTTRELQRSEQTLRTWAERLGYEVEGTEPTLSRYDPPWTLPFLRRTEQFLRVTP